MRACLICLAAPLLLTSACASAPSLSADAPSAPAPSSRAGAARFVIVEATEPREQTLDQQVQQVLNRMAFGPRPGEVAAVRAMGVDRWIATQLAPDRIDDSIATRVVATYGMLGRPTSEFVSMYTEVQRARRQVKQAAPDSGGRASARAALAQASPRLAMDARQSQRILGDVQSARLARAVVGDRQLLEVMTDFWENHFTVYAGKGVTRLFIPSYDRDVIRPYALGHFRELLGAVAKSPAMLFYLDQFQSAADSMHPTLASSARGQQAPTAAQRRRLASLTPQQRAQLQQRLRQTQQQQARRGLNENFARELLELHTLGVDGGYTQQDVIEVARSLTGWTMNPRGDAAFVFRPALHDAGEKRVLGVTIPAGRGIEDGEQVLDLLARHPATARFIAQKLAVRLVSDAPPKALVDRATATYLATDGDIREVVRTIVTSPEFFSRAAYRAKVKSPFELVASALRAVGADADTTVRSAQLVAYLGAPIFGHQAPNGYPETGEAWMNSGAILNRINFGLGLAAGRIPGASLSHWPQAATLERASREQQVDGVVQAFLGGQASPDTRQILMSGENPLAATLQARVGADSSARSAAMTPPRDMSMTDDAMTGAQRPRQAASQRVPRSGAAGAAVARSMGRQVQLSGLAQIVGLAIGAPEFQRR